MVDDYPDSTPQESFADDGRERDAHSPFPVVGIGASAGGLEAFRRLLSALSGDSGMAFLLVQHLAPQHESRLTEILAKATPLPVLEATDGMPLQIDHVYVIPPNSNMAVSQGVIRVTPRAEGPGIHLPVDFLFRSLAEEQQGRAVGVILSGSGSDGTLGLCEIKAVGGITFAQDDESAAHQGMPASARHSGCVDFVLDPETIATRLLEIGAHPYLAHQPPGDEARDQLATDEDFRQVLTIVRRVMGVDFSLYRETTIRRRIMRRMALHSHAAMADYVERLRKHTDEVIALYHDLLINVTSFFRDPEMFEALKTSVFPELAKSKRSNHFFRIWVPGCSTGQEAYSIAIALIEFYDDRPYRPTIQIFATDLSDQTALDRARGGVYPDTIESEVSPERLRRFFKKEDDVYRIDKSIRDLCVFARQNVTADPPFSHLDLISCRNVLIYLAPPLQKRVIPTFHYALDAPGFLVLGSAESIGEHGDLFGLVDRSQKIYAKKSGASRLPTHFGSEDLPGSRRQQLAAGPRVDFKKEADRILLGRFSPPAALVNQNFDILQFRGRTSGYLESPPGEPTANILKMARDGLFLALRSALDETQQTAKVAIRKGVRLAGENGAREVAIEVLPVASAAGQSGCLLVLFHDMQVTPRAAIADGSDAPVGPAGAEGQDEIHRLRQELGSTKEYMQSLAERQDAVNEELRSANEEILSSNEELQSTNEELETAKEELQSTNEELTTVNEQLNHRNIELTQVHSDLANLLTNTNIPVVMVGSDLRIRRYTGSAKRMMNLLPTDIGRLITDVRIVTEIPDFAAVVAEVIDRVQPAERELRDKSGRWFTVRVTPYRSVDNRIEGAVILIVDVDEIRRGQDALVQTANVLRDADRQKDQFLATLAHELRNPIAPILNAIEIMRLAGDDLETVGEMRGILDRQVRQLSGIVEDLIDIGRIVEKKIELRTSRIPLEQVVRTAVESVQPLMESCGHTLTVELPAEPVALHGDRVRLSQVLVNLLNNAAKYTPSGGAISLRAHEIPANDDGSGPQIVIRVRDSGVGISSESVERIFEMFEQGSAPKHGGQGLGVGLTLVRSLVQMHGGTVEVRSDGPGRGSEFTVRLPGVPSQFVVSDGKQEQHVHVEAGADERILIVDDNHDQAESLGKLLQMLGYEVRLSFDGEEALGAAFEFQPDVILLDLGLPKLSGYEVAERFAKDPTLRNALLIAQTGWGQERDRERTKLAGFHHHLVKPVDVVRLQEILADARKGRPA